MIPPKRTGNVVVLKYMHVYMIISVLSILCQIVRNVCYLYSTCKRLYFLKKGLCKHVEEEGILAYSRSNFLNTFPYVNI